MTDLEKFGRAEEKTKFKWGIPLHRWLKAPCFRSQHLLVTTVFLPLQQCGTQEYSLEQDSVFSPVCGNTEQPCKVRMEPSQSRLLPKS